MDTSKMFWGAVIVAAVVAVGVIAWNKYRQSHLHPDPCLGVVCPPGMGCNSNTGKCEAINPPPGPMMGPRR